MEGGSLNSLREVRALTSLQGDTRRLWVVTGVAGLMLLFAVHLALISRANTITWDEPDHIYSGYMSWHGDFGLNPEHPPLVKFVATVPLLPMQLNVPELQDRPYRLQAVLGGRDFIFHNDADKMVFRAQMAASIFTLLLLVIAFLAAQEMFNTTRGLPCARASGVRSNPARSRSAGDYGCGANMLFTGVDLCVLPLCAIAVRGAGDDYRACRRTGVGVQAQRCPCVPHALDSRGNRDIPARVSG
jgi:hypothetical protein